jgi:DNA-binding transcriptional MocR family regulator
VPVNSFEDYPLSWKTEKAKLKKPYFESIAQAIEEDITSGKLAPNTQLPPQRELSDYLDLNLSTVTRAYELLKRKGYLYAVTGKGSFVRPNDVDDMVLLPDGHQMDVIEMGSVEPFPELNKVVLKAANKVLERPAAINLLKYAQPWDNRYHLQIAGEWLKKFHIDVPRDHLMITSGGQNALTTAALSLFRPGDKIATDLYTYPNFIGLAALLQITLIPVENDGNGMDPKALKRLCQEDEIKGIYLMPTCANPTVVTLPLKRREDLVQVIREEKLILIEDDHYAFLTPGGDLPLYALIPEQTVYICGTSNSISAGLRVAFMVYPASLKTALINGAKTVNLKTAPINAAIIVELIVSGVAGRIIEEKKQLAAKRNAVFVRQFPKTPYFHENAFFQWLPLPDGVDGKLIETLALKAGVRVLCSQRFAVGKEKRSHIRVATCSPKTTEEFQKGLLILKTIIEDQDSANQKPGLTV